MYILLCGKQGTGKSSVAEALKDYYSYRGTACFAYDFMSPIQEAHDAVYLALQRYGLNKPPEDLYHRLPYQLLYTWLDLLLPSFMEKNVDPIVKRWHDLKMFHIAVIHGMTEQKQLNRFPYGFKVLLTGKAATRVDRVVNSSKDSISSFCIRDHDHPIEAGFDNCNIDETFDLVVDTDKLSPAQIADVIGEALHIKLFGPAKT